MKTLIVSKNSASIFTIMTKTMITPAKVVIMAISSLPDFIKIWFSRAIHMPIPAILKITLTLTFLSP